MGFLSRLFGGKRDSVEETEKEMVSLVVLLTKPLGLDVESTRKTLNTTFTGQFLPESDDSFVVEGSNPYQLMLKSVVPSNSGMFMANFVPAPYADLSSFSAVDPVFQRRVIDHSAWLSVDEIARFGSKEDSYRFIGKCLAAFSPVTSIAVVHPQSQTIVPFNVHARSKLENEDVLTSFGIVA